MSISCLPEVIRDSPAIIITQPKPTTEPLYTAINLTCLAVGTPEPSIFWYKDGKPLSEEKLPFLYIPEVQLQDRGFYHCEATNTIRKPDDPDVTEETNSVSDEVVVNIKGDDCGHLLERNQREH